MDNKIKALYEKLKEKKGNSGLESVIHYIILIILIAFILALIVNSNQHLFMNKIGNHAARKIAIQSGILTSVPENYPGGAEAYVTSPELNAYLKSCYKDINIDKFTVHINGTEVTPYTNILVNKGEPLDIEITCDYEWVGLQFTGKLKEGTAVFRSTVYGEYDKNL